ncbi:MarR family winged helix-turn-helix transcriptional regulator [Chitinophaga rhizophila]|uniref:Winged helix DNA-binding protein n=1 Tax=Chitinophaga rhizophila TaxID=2866212 RepID=A0ABS7GAV4_9BACT|nr:MarR family transcriptional regulator [Chitinophaga rhizophila]MBW8684405.1 winged helix DNA-binding protein [Chitinophaga rhizophila]
MNSSLDEQLEQHLAQRQHSLIRMLGLLKKDMDCRIMQKLQQKGYNNFKLGDLVLIVNIEPEGTINNELARKARITKQAMSKVVKNLEAGGFIHTCKHASDARAAVISLTDEGKKLIICAAESFEEIQEEYTHIVGAEDAVSLKRVLSKLVFSLHPQC